MNLRNQILSQIICVALLVVVPLPFIAIVFSDSPQELSWEQLVPPNWNPNSVFDEFTDEEFATMSNEEYAALQDEAQRLLKTAPTVDKWDGQRVRIGGFLIPTTFERTRLREYFLVPFLENQNIGNVNRFLFFR